MHNIHANVIKKEYTNMSQQKCTHCSMNKGLLKRGKVK